MRRACLWLVVLVLGVLPLEVNAFQFNAPGHVLNVDWVGSAFDSATSSMGVPSKAGALGSVTQSGVPFWKNLTLKVDSVAGSKLGRLALSAGKYLPLIQVAADAWLLTKEMQYNPSVPEVRELVAGGYGFTESACSGACVASTPNVCDSAVAATYNLRIQPSGTAVCNGEESSGCSFCGVLGLNDECYQCCWCRRFTPPSYYQVIPRVGGLVEQLESSPGGVVSWDALELALRQALAANEAAAWAFVKEFGKATQTHLALSNQTWPNGEAKEWQTVGSPLTASQGQTIQNTYNETINQTQLTSLADASPDDPNDPYAGWEDWEYSPSEIASAIEEKLAPHLDPGEVTVEAEGDPPDKDDLPGVLDDFADGVEDWQGLTLLNSLTLETSNSNCQFCIEKPAILGLSGEVCYDCCPHESMLAAVGDILFGIMALCWLFWVFM